MINYLHSLYYRPESGWDPVPREHAEQYAKSEWENFNSSFVDYIEGIAGSFRGKRVLDLGGGPGQYSIEFARRGAQVVWHDVSRNYLNIVRGKAQELGLAVEFSIGYLEESKMFRLAPFDFVFNRICWNYCMNDEAFAGLVYSLVKPGGACYIDCTTSLYDEIRGIRRIVYGLNNLMGWKIGHPYPPHGRIARLLQAYPMEYMILDYKTLTSDRVFFVKRGSTIG